MSIHHVLHSGLSSFYMYKAKFMFTSTSIQVSFSRHNTRNHLTICATISMRKTIYVYKQNFSSAYIMQLKVSDQETGWTSFINPGLSDCQHVCTVDIKTGIA
jgi:hypothetical protein